MEADVLETDVSAADANRSCSHILREVRGGATYVVTTHGKPVARIVPFGASDAARATARSALLQRLRDQAVSDIGSWRRDDPYDR